MRRAGGHDQERGALEIIFAVCVGGRPSSAFGFWFFIIAGPRPVAGPDELAHALGLLDYYRQFEDVDEEELNKVRRARRAREKALALEQVPDLDLSGTEWPELPNSEVVNASIYTARGRVNGYPDRHAEDVRRALAERHDVEPERIVLGNGAAELLQAAALALLGDGRRAAHAVALLPAVPADGRPRRRAAGGRWRTCPSCADAVTERTRLLVLCNPNDPTGALPDRRADRLDRLASCPSACTCWSTRRWCTSRTPSRWTRCCA